MKTLGLIAVLMFLFLATPAFPQNAGTKARINEEMSNDIWSLDKGSANGAVVGLEGFLMKKTYSRTDKKFIEKKIAHFKVSKTFKVFCHVKVDKWEAGYSSKDVQWAQFLKPLVPPTPKTGNQKKKIKPKPRVKEKKVESNKTQRWYLDKGDQYFKQEKYSLALVYYEKVLEKDPDEPGAKLRIKTTKGHYYIKQGELEYQNEEYTAAYDYYIMAFRLLVDKDYVAAEKIVDMWDKYEGFYERMAEYDIKPDEVLEALLRRCVTLLEQDKKDELAALAQKIVAHARNDQIKNRIDTLIAAKKIQADIDAGNFDKSLELATAAIDENNIYKASYIIQKLDALALDDQTKTRLTILKEKLRSKEIQIQLQKEKKQKEEKIKHLEQEALGFAALKKYDDAIQRYMDIYKLMPEKKEYGEKIKQLQKEKFKYETFQRELAAKVKMEEYILKAKDMFERELVQDSLDYYVKAYKEFPDEPKTIAGIVGVLETCEATDVKFLDATLLGRKLSKFTKDFLEYMEKEYLGKKDEKGLGILTKIVFINKDNAAYHQLLQGVKDNIYAKNLKLGHEKFQVADFVQAASYYGIARDHKEIDEIKNLLAVCEKLQQIEELLNQDKKKDAAQIIAPITSNPNKFEIMTGLLNLSDKYLDQMDFKKAKFLYKKVNGFNVAANNTRIQTLKQKEKDLKKKQKEQRKN